MNIGQIIKIIRTMDGISQGELAKRLKVSNVYMSLIEKGKKEPSLSLLKGFSEQFDIPLPLLFVGVGNEEEEEILCELRNLLKVFLSNRSFVSFHNVSGKTRKSD